VTDKIRVLDDSTINKIAAGEVVERPASIIKELVENSLDAGASSVSIRIEDGGRELIAVRDDGCGMSREDALMAFQRHATSKISTIDDLQKLSSYGFRGEALAAIAAVSSMTLGTKEHEVAEGTEIIVYGGTVERPSPAGVPAGTEVCVEELFANVPARRKSLKSKNIELSHCRDVVMNYLLCRPGISFSFLSDNEPNLVHVPAEGMKGSLSAAFGTQIAENMLFGETDGPEFRVEVYLGRLEQTRSSPADLRIFVNDRPVRSPRLVSAVVGTYSSRLMKDRYPIGVVRIFVSSSMVDVNVHPAKREVRFEDEAPIVEAVARCVDRALQEPNLTFKYDLTKFARSFEPLAKIPESEIASVVQSTLRIEDLAVEGQESPSISPLAQIMDTYILAESRGNLVLVDQHAASERVVYEAVLKSIETGNEISQQLLSPLVIHLSASEERVLEENRDALEKAGFAVEKFGKDSHAIRSLPTVLGVAQGESSFRNILGDLANMAPSKKLGLDVIWRVACHTAIRAGERLSVGQMRQLVHDLMHTGSPYTCEHGRPTMIILSPGDLEKLFKRRV